MENEAIVPIQIDNIRRALAPFVRTVHKDVIYSFVNEEGQEVIGISGYGARILAAQFNISIEECKINETSKGYVALVKAKLPDGRYAWGTYHQPKEFFSKKRNKIIEDRYAIQKAVSKAQRNAILQLIPIPKTIIREIKDQKVIEAEIKEEVGSSQDQIPGTEKKAWKELL